MGQPRLVRRSWSFTCPVDRECKPVVRCLPDRQCLSAQLGDTRPRDRADTGHMLQEVEQLRQGRQDEQLSILAWRIAVLDRAGYDEGDAVLLAAVKDVDLHLAVDLLDEGCSPETALRILL